MPKNRLEAFSDGVLAIIITILVLELETPHGPDAAALVPLVPVFLGYVLSFLYVGIYWNNHHHLLHALRRASAGVLWANLHLLFWLSLLPFATGWMGRERLAPLPTAVYGGVLLMAAVAYYVLQGAVLASEGPDSALKRELGRDWKGKGSVVAYAAAILLALRWPWLAQLVYALVAALWLVPDRRVEKALRGEAD